MAEILRDVIAQRIKHASESPRPLVRAIEPAQPYPLAALGPLRTAAEAIEAHTKAPVAICAQSVLGAVSLVTQAHADVVLPSGQTRPTSLFLMTIAASGERKSAVDALALRAIYEREAELRLAYETETSAYKAAYAIWEERQAQAKSELRSAGRKRGEAAVAAEANLRATGTAPEPPLAPILICPEPTFEGYCKLTAMGHPALGLFSAEGGSFIGGFGMSKDQKLKTAAGISSVWDGDPIKRVRAGDGAMVLAGRRMSLHLMAQPDVAARMVDDELLRNQGLLSRLLVVAPASTAGTRIFADPPESARHDLRRYDEHLDGLIRHPLPLREQSRNELVPRKLGMTSEARAVWIALHDHVERDLGQDGEFSPIPGLANKAAEHAARLSATLALWADVTAKEIDAEIMGYGALLVQHYLAESLRLRSIAATHGILRLAQRVLDWLHRKWPQPAIYPAVIYNDCTIRDVRERKTALSIIKILEEHGWLLRLTERVYINGVSRKEAWLIYGRTLP